MLVWWEEKRIVVRSDRDRVAESRVDQTRVVVWGCNAGFGYERSYDKGWKDGSRLVEQHCTDLTR
jgi:hypothetical protein